MNAVIIPLVMTLLAGADASGTSLVKPNGQSTQQPPKISVKLMVAEVRLAEGETDLVHSALRKLKQVDHEKAGKGSEPPVPTDNFTASLTEGKLDRLLTLLKENGELLQFLSRPTVLMENNEPASIVLGSRLPEPCPGKNQENQPVFLEDIGFEIDITPQLMPGSDIRIDLRSVFSILDEKKSLKPDGAIVPTYDDFSMEKVITFTDGETVLIGGLIPVGAQTRNKQEYFMVMTVNTVPVENEPKSETKQD